MTIHLLQIPSEPANWASWLEGHFCRDRLGELVCELGLVREPGEQFPDNLLSDILNPEQLESVRQSGLRVLTPAQVQQLMASPACLLELQETLLSKGCGYWDAQLQTPELQQPAEHIRQRVQAQIHVSPSAGASHTAETVQGTWSRRLFISVAVTAAAAVLGVMFWPAGPHRGSGRILGQAGLVTNDVDSSSAYLSRLADAGATWFDHRPANKQELVVLLSEVSNDCQLLIDAPHEPLSAPEREWFVTKCRNWKTKFDETLANLNADRISFADAQSAADATMTKLVDVLRAGPSA